MSTKEIVKSYTANPKRFDQRPISASFIDHIFWPEESPEKKSTAKKKKNSLTPQHP